jgi:hypothetical protein
MIAFTRTTRVILIAGATLALAAPAASAKPLAAFGTSPLATSSQGYHGTYRPVNDRVQASPDVQDRVGTVNQVTGIHALPVATKTIVSNDSFDWTDAAIGAGSVAAAGLIGAGALGLRGRRRMALGV